MENEAHLIRARIVLPADMRGWILEKFANRLVENLPEWGVNAEIGDEPSADVDINHWGIYISCTGKKKTPGTFFITHIDSFWRMQIVKTALDTADIGICMSAEMVNSLVRSGIPKERLCYINPGADLEIRPRRIVIGLTTNIYSDKRKREDVLLGLAHKKRLDSFEFRIIGKGWENVAPVLEAAGAKIWLYTGSDDYQADYKTILEAVPQFDYYLYMGLDEGSMGILDALAAGVPTIVTPQGFHLDIPNGITYPFWDTSDLIKVFGQIETERQSRIQSVQNLTWKEYARKHAIVWRALLSNQVADVQSALSPGQPTQASPMYEVPFLTRFNMTALYYVKPVRNYLFRIQQTIKKIRKKKQQSVNK